MIVFHFLYKARKQRVFSADILSALKSLQVFVNFQNLLIVYNFCGCRRQFGENATFYHRVVRINRQGQIYRHLSASSISVIYHIYSHLSGKQKSSSFCVVFTCYVYMINVCMTLYFNASLLS